MAYIVVTADNMELPVIVEEDANQMAIKMGKSRSVVYSTVSRGVKTKYGNQWVRIKRVDLDGNLVLERWENHYEQEKTNTRLSWEIPC